MHLPSFAFSAGTHAKNRDALVVALCAALIETLWFSVQNIGYQCDSVAYFRCALQMAGVPQPTHATWTRTPGYPLLLLLTVGPFTSFIGLLLAQAAMAVAMPVIFYRTLAFYHRTVALWGALLFTFSLVPFLSSKLVMTEHLYKFLSVLLMYFFCRALAARSLRFTSLLPLTLTGVMWLLTRPAALPIVIMLLGLLLLARPRHWRAIGASLALPFLALAATSLWLSFYTLLPFDNGWSYEKPRTYSRLTELQFYDLYINAPEILWKEEALQPALGAFLSAPPRAWENRTPEQYFRPFRGRPEALQEEILHTHARPYFLLVRDAALTVQDLLPQTIRQAYREHPGLVAAFWWRYATAAMQSFGGGAQNLAYAMFSHDRVARLKAENGPASAEFLRILKGHFAFHSADIAKASASGGGGKDYSRRPDALVDDLVAGNPGEPLFYRSWGIVDGYLGPIGTAQLFTHMSEEGIARGWTSEEGFYAHFFRRGMQHLGRFFLDPFVGRGFPLFAGLQSSPFYFDHNLVQCAETYQPRMNEELRSGVRLWNIIPNPPDTVFTSDHYRSSFDVGVHILWAAGRLIAEIVIVLGICFCVRSKAMLPIVAALVAVAQHALLSSFIVGAQTRYVDQILPLLMLCAGLVAAGVAERFRNAPPAKDTA